MRTLTFHYGGLIHAGAHDVRQRRGGAISFKLERDYKPIAHRVSLSQPVVGRGEAVIVDINDDGVSILAARPALGPDQTFVSGSSYAAVGLQRLVKGSVMTLDIDQTGPGASALTVELDLEEI